MKHINDKAIIANNRHYVNASELMEVCNNTFDELAGLINAELTSDNLMENIVGIIKQDAKDRLGIDLDKKDDVSDVL